MTTITVSPREGLLDLIGWEARLSPGPRSIQVADLCEMEATRSRTSAGWLADASRWGKMLGSGQPVAELPDQLLASAAASLTGPGGIALRDALIAGMCPDVFGHVVSDQIGQHYARIVAAAIGPSPDWRAQLVELCAALPDQPVAVPTLSLLGAVAWAQGHACLAQAALERALSIDPGYRLGCLIYLCVVMGVPPQR